MQNVTKKFSTCVYLSFCIWQEENLGKIQKIVKMIVKFTKECTFNRLKVGVSGVREKGGISIGTGIFIEEFSAPGSFGSWSCIFVLLC
jgi:hypothetical protein